MANITTQTIRVDLSTDKVIPSAFTHQNDTARTLVFDMYNGGMPYTMTGNTVKFAYKSPIVNGQYSVIAGASMASGTVSGNKVSVTLPAAYTAISGVGMLTMIITPTSGTVRPVNIRLVVQSSADGDDVVLHASDWPEGLYDYMDNWLAENEPTEIANLKSDLLELQNGGYVADAQRIGEVIDDWLDDHPEATTTVQDGSITEAKIAESLAPKVIKDYYTPEMFGAKGDGTTDDSLAFASAISQIPTGAELRCYNSYNLPSGITINRNINFANKGTLKTSTAAPFVTVDGVSNVNIELGNLVKSSKTFDYTEANTNYSIGALVNNAASCTITAQKISNFTTGWVLVANGEGIHYNNFRLGTLDTFEGIDLFTKNGGWINGNIFDGLNWEIHTFSGNSSLVPQTMIKHRSTVSSGTPYASNANMFYNLMAECGQGINSNIEQRLIDCNYSRGWKFFFDRIEIQGGTGEIANAFVFDSNSTYNVVFLAFILNPYNATLGTNLNNRIIKLESIAETGVNNITSDVTLNNVTYDNYYFHVVKNTNEKSVHVFGTLKTTAALSGSRILSGLPTCAAGMGQNFHVDISSSGSIWSNPSSWDGRIASISGGDDYIWIIGNVPSGYTIYIDFKYYYS